MVRIIKTTVKLLIRTIIFIACFGLFTFVYIVVLLSELGTNKPKLAVH